MKKVEIEQQTSCLNCGAILKFAPGTTSLKCTSCQATVEIKSTPTEIEEFDFEEFLANQFPKEEKIEVLSVQCNKCDAAVTFKPNTTSDTCPFCATSLVLKNGTTSLYLKPKTLLPFKLKESEALESFRHWLKGLWFAPNDLKKLAGGSKKFNGMYIPYWTYDSSSSSHYSGQRGDNYYVTESYQSYENGKSVTRTRTVTKIRWHFVSGQVSREFDDVLVNASHSLPEDYAQALEPWDLHELVSFDERYLSGFRTECYQIDVAQGWINAKKIMDGIIRQDVCADIGGDHQRISALDSHFREVKFKHTLLPIWISSFKYNKKTYLFLVNGRTGEVQGQRPYSWIKITLLALVVISVVILVAMNQN